MSEEWITGGGTSDAGWGGGHEAAGMPGIRVGPGARGRLMAGEGVRILLVGDFALEPRQEPALLRAAAEERWADLTYLPGSYWVVADGGGRRFVCGDLSGFRSVFHAHGPGAVWSTGARRLAGHCSAVPDLAMVAARLAAGPEHWPHRTVYDRIQAVPAGSGLLLGGRAGPELVGISGIEPTLTLSQGASTFGQALEQAVHGRMRTADGVAGADVSGGLDSSAVAILASQTGEIRAVTYADAFTSSEDLAFARRAAAHMDVDLHVGQGGPGELPFGWSREQPVTDQPAAVSLTTAQHALYLRPAAGLPLHFTGHGGDVVLDSCSAAWIGMVQCGARKEARRQVTNWARARNRAPRELWRAVTRAANTGHAGALQEAAARVTRGESEARRPGVWSWCHLGACATWLTPSGREQVASLLSAAARQAREESRADLVEQETSLRLVGADARDTVALTAPWRVRQVHPYLDNQVVRAAFAITPIERHGVRAFKPLLSAALPSLPAWLTSRQKPSAFRM
ncbi:asparagine synthase [Streptomyces sp. AV19]|nr:asparagine synthase [Streptomyces sp. AV19]MBH1939157.1 asparagine synthase [Streptomyces sp. AV19]MDG4536833.1 asparagine synthase-related protein [Streptomyces sp. AV19]